MKSRHAFGSIRIACSTPVLLASCLFTGLALAQELSIETSIGGSSYFFELGPGELACYGEGSRLVLADVDSLSTPLGTLELGARLEHAVFAFGTNHLFVSAGHAGFKLVDVAVPSDPQVLLTIPVDGEATASQPMLSEDETRVVLFATKYPDNFVELPTTTLYHYDITDPDAPVLRATYAAAGESRFAVEEGTAYVTDNSAVQILDITDPASVTVIGTVQTWQGRTPLCVAIHGNQLLVGDATGITVADVQNPAQPQLVGFLELALGPRDIVPFENGQGAFVTGAVAGVVAVDLTNPAEPLVIGGAGPQGYSLNIVNGLAAVAQGEDGIALYDIDPLPSLDAQLYTPTNRPVINMVANQNYLYAITSPVAVVLQPQGLALLNLGPAGFYNANFIIDLVSNDGFIYMLTVDNFLHVYDLADPDDPVEVGAVEVGQMTALDAKDGIVITVGTVDNVPTFRVVDATTPAAPVSRGGLTLADLAKLTMVDPNNPNLAYFMTSKSLQIADITNPDDPQALAGHTYGEPFTTLPGGLVPSGMAIAGNHLYISGSSPPLGRKYFMAVDVSNPAGPTGVLPTPLPLELKNMQIVGGALYGIDESFIVRMDISDPAHPQVTGRFFAPNQPTAFVVEGDAVYTAGENGYFSFNVNDYEPIPQVQAHKSALPVADPPVALGEDTIVVRNDLTVIDLNDPNSISQGESTAPLTEILFDRLLGDIVALHNDGIEKHDVSDPVNPTRVWSIDQPFVKDAVVRNGTLYTAGEAGLTLYNFLADPPTVIGQETTSLLHGIAVQREIALAVGYAPTPPFAAAFQVIDVSNPAQPVPRGSLHGPASYSFPYVDDAGTWPTFIGGYGAFAFKQDVKADPKYGDAGIVSIDVSDPDHPVELDVLPAGRVNHGMARDGNRVYLAAGADGIIVVDISDPADLKIVETFKTAGPATDVDAVGGRIVATLGTGGLVVLRGITSPTTGPDIDGNGEYNAIDVQLVVNDVLAIDIGPYSGDVNTDGLKNAIDVQLVVNAALGIL